MMMMMMKPVTKPLWFFIRNHNAAPGLNSCSPSDWAMPMDDATMFFSTQTNAWIQPRVNEVGQEGYGDENQGKDKHQQIGLGRSF